MWFSYFCTMDVFICMLQRSFLLKKTNNLIDTVRLDVYFNSDTCLPIFQWTRLFKLCFGLLHTFIDSIWLLDFWRLTLFLYMYICCWQLFILEFTPFYSILKWIKYDKANKNYKNVRVNLKTSYRQQKIRTECSSYQLQTCWHSMFLIHAS